jgi:hypothetical protein
MNMKAQNSCCIPRNTPFSIKVYLSVNGRRFLTSYMYYYPCKPIVHSHFSRISRGPSHEPIRFERGFFTSCIIVFVVLQMFGFVLSYLHWCLSMHADTNGGRKGILGSALIIFCTIIVSTISRIRGFTGCGTGLGIWRFDCGCGCGCACGYDGWLRGVCLGCVRYARTSIYVSSIE